MVEAVPTAAQRRGDFSDLLAIGTQYQIYDPYSTTPAAGGLFTRTPVPNNVIPSNRINPVSAKIASLWDTPNQQGTVDGTNNYTMGKNAQDTYGNELVRIDHNASQKERFYVRGNLTNLQRPENIRQNLTVGDNFYRFNRGISADNVYMVSPHLLCRFAVYVDTVLYGVYALSGRLGSGRSGLLIAIPRPVEGASCQFAEIPELEREWLFGAGRSEQRQSPDLQHLRGGC